METFVISPKVLQSSHRRIKRNAKRSAMVTTRRIVQEMVEAFADELKEARIDGREVIRKAREHMPRLHRIGDVVFRRWANLFTAGTSVSRNSAC